MTKENLPKKAEAETNPYEVMFQLRDDGFFRYHLLRELIGINEKLNQQAQAMQKLSEQEEEIPLKEDEKK